MEGKTGVGSQHGFLPVVERVGTAGGGTDERRSKPSLCLLEWRASAWAAGDGSTVLLGAH